MEIHRPKPFHGWRELAKEVGVITIGIAIALSGEQVLEWLHRNHEVSEAREALRTEIAFNARYALITVEEGRCLSAFLDKAAAWLHGGPPPPRVGVTGFVGPLSTTWETVKSGAVARMPLEERLNLSRFYSSLEEDRENSQRQIAAINTVEAEITGLADGTTPKGAVRDGAVHHALGAVATTRRAYRPGSRLC